MNKMPAFNQKIPTLPLLSGKIPQKIYKNPKNCFMDFKQIQELIKIINKSNIGKISIEEKDFKVTIKQKEEKTAIVAGASAAPIHLPSPPSMVPSSQPAVEIPAVISKPSPALKTDNLITIK